MKRILFNDKFGLTQAVLEGRKTMTRRIVPTKILNKVQSYQNEYFEETLDAISEAEAMEAMSPIKVGEVVAVSQAYRDIEEYNPDSYEDVMLSDGAICEASHPYSNLMRSGGWDNKMFVRADLMPYQIRITNIKVERLQDISDDDCIREGIVKCNNTRGYFNGYAYDWCYDQDWDILATQWFKTPREAFAALIDKVSGKGTFERNPWVFVYEFELVK